MSYNTAAAFLVDYTMTIGEGMLLHVTTSWLSHDTMLDTVSALRRTPGVDLFSINVTEEE